MENARLVAGTDKIVLFENVARLLATGCPSPDEFYEDMNSISRCASMKGTELLDQFTERIGNGDTDGM